MTQRATIKSFEELHGRTIVSLRENPAWDEATINASGTGVSAVASCDGCQTTWSVTWEWKQFVLREFEAGLLRLKGPDEPKIVPRTSGDWNSFRGHGPEGWGW